MFCFNDGKALAMKNRSHRTLQHTVNLAILSEIRDLRRSPKIADCRQQVILNYWPQHDARTESLWLIRRDPFKLGHRELSLIALCAIDTVSNLSQRRSPPRIIL